MVIKKEIYLEMLESSFNDVFCSVFFPFIPFTVSWISNISGARVFFLFSVFDQFCNVIDQGYLFSVIDTLLRRPIYTTHHHCRTLFIFRWPRNDELFERYRCYLLWWSSNKLQGCLNDLNVSVHSSMMAWVARGGGQKSMLPLCLIFIFFKETFQPCFDFGISIFKSKYWL